jgi:hypothetical protein
VEKTRTEQLEVERHSPAEAEAAASEHRPVADPPGEAGSPMVPSETDSRDHATHVERINPEQVSHVMTDANGRQWLVDQAGNLAPVSGGPIHRVISYAADGHPEGVRWPYTLTQPAVVGHVRCEAGVMVWLLPHEVAAFHRPVDKALFKALGVQGK